MYGAVRPGRMSFCGLVRYLCRDAQDTGAGVQPRRIGRVAFVGKLNLPACSPEDAAGIMTTTVRDAEDLKALAGRKTYHGPPLSKPGYHYCCSWAPGERPLPGEVSDAVRGSLAAQGLGEHQILFVVHIDTAHCHGPCHREPRNMATPASRSPSATASRSSSAGHAPMRRRPAASVAPHACRLPKTSSGMISSVARGPPAQTLRQGAGRRTISPRGSTMSDVLAACPRLPGRTRHVRRSGRRRG